MKPSGVPDQEARALPQIQRHVAKISLRESGFRHRDAAVGIFGAFSQMTQIPLAVREAVLLTDDAAGSERGGNDGSDHVEVHFIAPVCIEASVRDALHQICSCGSIHPMDIADFRKWPEKHGWPAHEDDFQRHMQELHAALRAGVGVGCPEVPRGVGEFTLHVRSPQGLHIRPARLFALACANIQGNVRVWKKDHPGKSVDGKSILELLTLGATHGTMLVVHPQDPSVDRAKLRTSLQQIVSQVWEEDK